MARYQIAEWFGRPLESLPAPERQSLAKSALQGTELPIYPKEFAVQQEGRCLLDPGPQRPACDHLPQAAGRGGYCAEMACPNSGLQGGAHGM